MNETPDFIVPGEASSLPPDIAQGLSRPADDEDYMTQSEWNAEDRKDSQLKLLMLNRMKALGFALSFVGALVAWGIGQAVVIGGLVLFVDCCVDEVVERFTRSMIDRD